MAHLLLLLTLIWSTGLHAEPAPGNDFDHAYRDYAALLRESVEGPRVDYQTLVSRRAPLEAVVREFGSVTRDAEAGWTREQRLAYWINAYNLFTLKAIVDHYPIQGSWFSFHPRNSIRQIDGVWTELTFQAGGRPVTLDDIEHRILRPVFEEPRIHFAINCASVSCPPLREEPYTAERLDAQLDDAARRYLASRHGLVVTGTTLRVSSIFDWYGDDFIAKYAGLAQGDASGKERAIRGTVLTFGPPEAQGVARMPEARVRFLRYDWSLNDFER